METNKLKLKIPNYEHLDIIMGDTKKDIVIQQVVEQLNHVIAGDYFESIKEEFGLDTELVDGVMNHTI